ncbi:MAG: hypothetical protein WCS34_07005 [Bacteroidales bacterium]
MIKKKLIIGSIAYSVLLTSAIVILASCTSNAGKKNNKIENKIEETSKNIKDSFEKSSKEVQQDLKKTNKKLKKDVKKTKKDLDKTFEVE